MKAKTKAQIPPCIGDVIIDAHMTKHPIPTLNRDLGKFPDAIFLPFRRGMDFVTIDGMNQFLLRYPGPLESETLRIAEPCFLGGEENGHAFLHLVDPVVFETYVDRGPLAFHELLQPEEFLAVQAKIGEIPVTRQGKVCAARLPAKWDDFKNEHWYIKANRNVRTSPVAGTRHMLNGVLISKATPSISDVVIHTTLGEGTIYSKDYAPRKLADAPHIFGQTRFIKETVF